MFLGTALLLLRHHGEDGLIWTGKGWLDDRTGPQPILSHDRDLQGIQEDLRAQQQEVDKAKRSADRSIQVGTASQLMAHQADTDRLQRLPADCREHCPRHKLANADVSRTEQPEHRKKERSARETSPNQSDGADDAGACDQRSEKSQNHAYRQRKCEQTQHGKAALHSHDE